MNELSSITKVKFLDDSKVSGSVGAFQVFHETETAIAETSKSIGRMFIFGVTIKMVGEIFDFFGEDGNLNGDGASVARFDLPFGDGFVDADFVDFGLCGFGET